MKPTSLQGRTWLHCFWRNCQQDSWERTALHPPHWPTHIEIWLQRPFCLQPSLARCPACSKPDQATTSACFYQQVIAKRKTPAYTCKMGHFLGNLGFSPTERVYYSVKHMLLADRSTQINKAQMDEIRMLSLPSCHKSWKVLPPRQW